MTTAAPATIEPGVARRIRLVGFDVDGVLTDGGVYMGAVADRSGVVSNPGEFKRFDIQDGLGIVLLRMAGLLTCVVTGRTGEAARMRAEELKVDDFACNSSAHKLEAMEKILARHHVRWDEVAFVGDDLPDLPLLKRVSLPVAVGNAVPEVKSIARYTTAAIGGHGAVREFIEAFLKARGVWKEVVNKYLHERGDVRD